MTVNTIPIAIGRKREPLNIELIPEALFKQKLEYIYYNPVKAGLCENPEGYYYSSARSDSYRIYYDGLDSFKMLTHLKIIEGGDAVGQETRRRRP